MTLHKMKHIIVASAILLASVPAVFANTGDTVTATATGTATVSTGATASGAATTATTATSAAEALNVPGAPELVTKTDTTVTLKWQKVATAKNYIVKYSKKSVAESTDKNATYENEIDPVSETGATIKNLKANTPYYFAVVALDSNNNESATNSEELSVSTLAEGATASGATATAEAVKSELKLVNVAVTDDRTLTVSFSAPVSVDSVTLKLTKSANSSNIPVVTVAKSTLPTDVSVKLGVALDPTSSYSLVVVTAKDPSGASITQGLNAVKEFSTAATLQKAAVAAAPITATGTGKTASGALVSGAAGVNGLNSAPANASGSLAANQLPATGAKENLLIALAALLGLAIAYAVKTRRA